MQFSVLINLMIWMCSITTIWWNYDLQSTPLTPVWYTRKIHYASKCLQKPVQTVFQNVLQDVPNTTTWYFCTLLKLIIRVYMRLPTPQYGYIKQKINTLTLRNKRENNIGSEDVICTPLRLLIAHYYSCLLYTSRCV